MINKIQIMGSLDTTLHDFRFSTEEMKFKIDGTHYTVAHKEVFKNYTVDENKNKVQSEGVEMTIEPNRDYEIYLTDLGIEVLYKSEGQDYGKLEGLLIDRLCWFTVPRETTTLDQIVINVLEVVEC